MNVLFLSFTEKMMIDDVIHFMTRFEMFLYNHEFNLSRLYSVFSIRKNTFLLPLISGKKQCDAEKLSIQALSVSVYILFSLSQK